jgi:hypothetical protein
MIGPTFTAKTEKYGFRIMGGFKKLEKAQEYAINLNKQDNVYDVGIMEMYLWCLGYPDKSDIILDKNGELDTKAMEEHRDKILNDYVVKHKTQLEERKQLFEIRKRAVMKSKLAKEADIKNAIIQNIPEGAPTEEMEAIHDNEIKKWIKDDMKKVLDDEDYILGDRMLDFDCKYKIPNQEYAIVSFIDYSGDNRRIPISIKGIFASEAEADERIKKILNIDDTFDMVAVPLYKWIPCDPDLSKINTVYKNNKLNELLLTDKEQIEKSYMLHKHNENNKRIENGEDIDNGDGDGDGDGEIAHAKIDYSATDALIDTQKSNENIRQKAKEFYSKTEEEQEADLYSFNPESNSESNPESITVEETEIKPMFKEIDNNIQKFEEKIKQIVLDEGITEKEARNRFIIKIEEKVEEVEEVEVEEVEEKKQLFPTIDFTEMEKKIEDLKEKGHTNAEIRKILNS